MDVLVEWDDNTRNVVSSHELQCVGKTKKLEKGGKVRMHWGNKYFYGTVLDTETLNMADDGGEGDLPLCNVEENTARKVEENSTRENSKKRERQTRVTVMKKKTCLSVTCQRHGVKNLK